jgi:hypothetical protein
MVLKIKLNCVKEGLFNVTPYLENLQVLEWLVAVFKGVVQKVQNIR